MLEGLVAWVLNNYLGKYVGNLNTDQLSIALLQGEVELENLPLKKDALRQFGLPIQVRSGCVGKIKLQIPVRQIRSAPWLIVIEQLCLVAGPIRLSEWDEEAEENAAQEYKLQILDALEAHWRAETEVVQDSSYYASSYSSWLNYGTGLVTNIVENLQLKIKDVHIRYEDDITVPGEAFVCGITIESLSMQSCDDKWMPKFTNRESGASSFKLLELNMLSVYWDALHVEMGGLALNELALAMSKSSTVDHHFLIAPVSAQAHIKHNRSEQPLRSKSQPRVVCDLHLEQVPLSLVDWQYAQMIGCIKGLSATERWCKQRKWRPSIPICENAQAWWLYAAQCHGLLLPTQHSWEASLQRARDNVLYVHNYVQTLEHPGSPPTDKILKDRIEKERSLEELRSLREVAMRKVRPIPLAPEARPTGAGGSLLLRWFPQWWYSTPNSGEAPCIRQEQLEEPDLLEDELLDALADSFENNTLLKRDVVFGQFNFTLKQGTFDLCTSSEDRKRKVLVELQFENVKLGFESRPRNSSHRLELELGALYLRDHLTPDTVFPVLISPQNRRDVGTIYGFPRGNLTRNSSARFTNTRTQSDESLFVLSYEQKPFNCNSDYRIYIKSQSLDVVYNPEVVKWLVDFFIRPHQKPDAQLRLAAKHRYEKMKQRTKEEFMRNWEQILEGDLIDRKVWDVELDISAPQIIFVEHFCDKNALIVVVDFGKFHFSNRQEVQQKDAVQSIIKESDDEDEFQTPCSTPPGSQSSEPDLSQIPSLPVKSEDRASLSEATLHQKLYDKYRMELGDIQILVGRVRDNWKYAHLKGTSTLHVLDRFNINLIVERRRLYTPDPNFPSLALAATLPRLVVHLNESKVQALRTITNIIAGGGLLPSPFRSNSITGDEDKEKPFQDVEDSCSTEPASEKTYRELSRLLMLQFTVEQLAIEVQSRGRSIAELQVSGVRASFTKRPFDTSISLSVHSLLLADALQTFGPDFELLIASHKHVGMDSLSGSLRDSEPTSPTSPGSPDPTLPRAAKATSPVALTEALSSLQNDSSHSFRALSPTWPGTTSPPIWARPPSITLEPLDAEALITIEILLVNANCEGSGEALQVASIQFNNLDIIANQETMVELVGFTQRVFPRMYSTAGKQSAPAPTPEPDEENHMLKPPTRTEVTFDFHRLNVLLLRAVMKDGMVVGRKIATATMSEAKIQATIGSDIFVTGSLGGLQLLNLTPEGNLHPRILSLGKDPLAERDLLAGLNADLYSLGQGAHSLTDALSFTIRRPLGYNHSILEEDNAEITIRMASVWYTHCPQLIAELQCCVTEFQQYLTKLAHSIKTAATEMAIGLVQARVEAQNLYANQRLSASFYSGVSVSETPSPKHRRHGSLSQSTGELLDTTATQTPYSPSEDDGFDGVFNIKLDINLESPVVVLPRSSASYQVFVAHLGKISVNNMLTPDTESMWSKRELYSIDIRDMNVYSLERHHTGSKDFHFGPDCPPVRAEKLYNCAEGGKPILHNTAVSFSIERHCGVMRHQADSLLFGAETPPDFQEIELHDMIQVTGNVISQLKISLSRQQYEQLLDSLLYLLSSPKLEPTSTVSNRRLGNIKEEEANVSALRMDPTLRAKMLESPLQSSSRQRPLTLKVLFDLPEFTVELKGDFGHGEKGIADLSFRDFTVQYDRSHRYETNIQMCLRSLFMEDLSKDPEDKHRYMVISSGLSESYQMPAYVSKSCPNLNVIPFPIHTSTEFRGSLPNHLGTGCYKSSKNVQKGTSVKKTKTVEYPSTPPPSPRTENSSRKLYHEDNLMHINITFIDNTAPNFSSYYNSVYRSVGVDFNSLDIVASIDSWVAVLDFFSIGSEIPSMGRNPSTETASQPEQDYRFGNTELEIDVRSVTLVLNLPIHEVARANISNFHAKVKSRGLETHVEGRLGSMSLLDLSPSSHLYRERFVTSGHEALKFVYLSYGQPDVNLERDSDSSLSLEMSSVLYVHTKRFVTEIQAFFHHFYQSRGKMYGIRAASIGKEIPEIPKRSSRLLVEIHAGSPVILLPVCTQSPEVLVVDLGKLTVNNSFKMSDQFVSSCSSQETLFDDLRVQGQQCLLDVMLVGLENMDLYPGRWLQLDVEERDNLSDVLVLGNCCITRAGPTLLKEKCQLHLKVERNLDTYLHFVPDMSIIGTLSAVDASLDLAQYKLIRGLLSYNIAECVGDLQIYFSPAINMKNSSNEQECRTLMVIQLVLVNVSLQLQREQSSPLACVNFIKSRLLLELLSNGSQDIDLVSQEILITDTRFQAEPVNKRSNVFTNILQPINNHTSDEEVQAEIHHRRRNDNSSTTILLKDMRLMAILDWWEAIRNFVFENAEVPQGAALGTNHAASRITDKGKIESEKSDTIFFELKLNITSSEVVLVEDTSQWDTNAVILKSNSVIMYRPQVTEKPLSCELNNFELFSCILGMEEETALSIVDPVYISVEVAYRKEYGNVLEVNSKDLMVRLSYHDMCMFMQILNSLPNQTLWARSQDVHTANQPTNIKNQVHRLVSLGFKSEDCLHALRQCNGHLDDAALWLTQNAIPVEISPLADRSQTSTTLAIDAISVETTCICVVVIDDCRDADVPLLELSLSHFTMRQKLGASGNASCLLFGDYYNRTLSGWEPFLEPWGCQICWDQSFSSNSLIVMKITSNDTLNINVTSTLMELYKTVKENWTQDYDSAHKYERNNLNSPPGYRRRLPFIPYALYNNTGSALWFTTLITSIDCISESITPAMEPDENWFHVAANETVPFTYEARGKVRHRDTHKHNMHQILVKVDGWQCIGPISVDKVGIYFRQAVQEQGSLRQSYLDVPQSRVVFDVTLEGSAKKLVTVRSALLIANRLQHAVELKLDGNCLQSEPTKFLHVNSGVTMPIPVNYVMSQLIVRPSDQRYQFCSRPIVWSHVEKPGEISVEHRQCRSNRDLCYRFCVAVQRENYPMERTRFNTWHQPGHKITLLSPLSIRNLLPYDVHYQIKCETLLEGLMKPSKSVNIQEVDTEESLDISFYLENFPKPATIQISASAGSFTSRIKIQDLQGRLLYINVAVAVHKGARIKVSVSVPFWIYNRSGLPLVFRQEGVSTDAAGQFDEHEVARMVAPLMFSFADPEAGSGVIARIGNRNHPDGISQWCNHFHLQKGLQVRRLRVALKDGSPDLVYLIGIEVRAGRGHHRVTKIVTLSPRYQIHNMSSHRLMIAQKCFATTLNDPKAETTHLSAVPDCSLAWHWPRLDKDQLLCLRLPEISSCLWSGGFIIDTNYSLIVNIRDATSKMYFLRVEVVLKGPSYCVVITDADSIPPPVRIDNFSEVSLHFYQSCAGMDGLRTCIRPHSSVPYVWDEPTQPCQITLVAPGGASSTYDMNQLGPGRSLTYENFIYIAFTGTFETGQGKMDILDVRGQQLVLEVLPGSSSVSLARKEHGSRSQLWRMSGDGRLQHEGSSPPRDQSGSVLVLDIAGLAPQPTQYTPLVIRRPDPRRRSTQTWRFTEGRLCCAHNNMCVQAKDGFYGLHAGAPCSGVSWQMWSEAVLGPPQAICHQETVDGIPLEQAVDRQRLRPGSGFLAIKTQMDGPTTVLQISDLKDNREHYLLPEFSVPQMMVQSVTTPNDTKYDDRELKLEVDLPSGVGVSIVSQHPPEELLYMLLKEIILNISHNGKQSFLSLQVNDIQCDNQLYEAQCPVVLHMTPLKSRNDNSPTLDPALELTVHKLPNISSNAEIYRKFSFTIRNLSISIEEKLLLKLFLFAGYNQIDPEQEAMEESDIETQRLVTEATSINTKRYYFGSLHIEPNQVRLSVLTSSKLPSELQAIKRQLGLTLIKFEDAGVDLEPFHRSHLFESSQFLVSAVIKHFKEVLKWQAAFILGSVDFLGNPLGLMNDVSEGMSGLLEGNVTALLRNVTHGLSNSAAKVTGSLSDGLGRVILDDQHEETRQRIRKRHTNSSGDHLVAGLKGLGFGLLGGVTSVFKQTYEGVATDGVQGFISGLGKGLVGTVTKPVVGMLDLASEAASAVRDSSRSSARASVRRIRETRCAIGTRGLLPLYDPQQSLGQSYLFKINERNYSELFIAYKFLRSPPEDLRILVSSEKIRVFTYSESFNIVLQIQLGDLFICKVVQDVGMLSSTPMYYIELTVRAESTGSGLVMLQDLIKKPLVRCDDEATAKQVSYHINYAKALYEERRNTLLNREYDILED